MAKVICVKCKCEIPSGVGLYNYPSGVQCDKCGSDTYEKDRAAVEKAKRLINNADMLLQAASELLELHKIERDGSEEQNAKITYRDWIDRINNLAEIVTNINSN